MDKITGPLISLAEVKTIKHKTIQAMASNIICGVDKDFFIGVKEGCDKHFITTFYFYRLVILFLFLNNSINRCNSSDIYNISYRALNIRKMNGLV